MTAKPAPDRSPLARVAPLLLGLLLALTLAPYAVMLLVSQKTDAEMDASFWSLPDAARPGFYAEAARLLWPYVLNSLGIAAASVAATVVLSALTGYVFARMDFGGKRFLFGALLTLMMVPAVLTLVPSFLWFKSLPLVGGNDAWGLGGTGLLDRRLVLLLPLVTGSQVLGVFLCRGFFEQLPASLFEAARLDGAGELRAFASIALPMSLPIVATVGMLTFVGAYNDFIWPLVTVSTESRQVFTVGITRLGASTGTRYGPVFAGYVVGSLPLLAVFALGMRYYVAGMTAGAVKE
ncbi:carbohydrate ABC transporter permease [Phycisphaera mikurensis]|uniref:Putative ABC transporter permease protein n=1 Tax=Phycisphaera mikurensis (strain NBRC 102666 / KCTC 22515 / FYK2301M01) TaxID=1142394 RepID=I0IFA4_PHYMF|nr:carbohydrate ABC transporter permease [Phycisphaera mikurensis]MBB6440663.1 ABC-type glycerol-3-phosphate transport system permease component [Phycisphaera mikurensis]BAM03942.1 putative ABC transporter permease protein [Phycisphaera mikurensis NBRC 102666]